MFSVFYSQAQARPGLAGPYMQLGTTTNNLAPAFSPVGKMPLSWEGEMREMVKEKEKKTFVFYFLLL